MTTIKLRTPDIQEVLDTVVHATSDHDRLAVVGFSSYFSIDASDINAAVVQHSAHGLANATPLAFLETSNAFPPDIVPSQIYYVVNANPDDFGISSTEGGSAIAFSSGGLGTHEVGYPGDPYSVVLAKIASRSPTQAQKDGLDASLDPSALNPYVTLDELNSQLGGRIAWVTVGPVGSGADFECDGTDDQVQFNAALAAADWVVVHAGTYNLSATLAIPSGKRLSGTVPAATILAGIPTPLVTIGDGDEIESLTLRQTSTGAAALLASNVACRNVIFDGPQTVVGAACQNVKLWECAFLTGAASLTNLQDSYLHGLYFDTGTNALVLANPSAVVLTSSTFRHGQLVLSAAANCRIVANHLPDGVQNNAPVPLPENRVVLRANSPKSVNNEADDFENLLRYIGSPDINETVPPFANNYGGALGDDLTTRAGSLDLLLQWRFEERNFHLAAETEPLYVTWDGSRLTTTGNIVLMSAHREAHWKFDPIDIVLADQQALYYVLDRALGSHDITLTPYTLPIGSIPNDRDSRQIYVLAFRHGSTLWWRGGGGSRFPGSAAGTYFVDGTSKSLLDFLGATDYNDSDPAYSSNFAGLQSESLVVRLGKTDTLLKRLFEYSNLGVRLSPDGFLWCETSAQPGKLDLTLSGSLYFSFPHAGLIETVANQTWALADGELLYVEWDQTASGAAVPNVATVVPMPDNNLTTKYFVVARRVGSAIWLWDDTEMPVGGRYPVPQGRSVVPTALPTLVGGHAGWLALDNMQWDGINLLWQGLAVACGTGIALARNTLPDTLDATPGLTDLQHGEGLVVTHSWNAGVAQNVTIQKVTVPVANVLTQTQFLWVSNLSGNLIVMR